VVWAVDVGATAQGRWMCAAVANSGKHGDHGSTRHSRGYVRHGCRISATKVASSSPWSFFFLLFSVYF
jgi:hypothetical protein